MPVTLSVHNPVSHAPHCGTRECHADPFEELTPVDESTLIADDDNIDWKTDQFEIRPLRRQMR
jgi:hypothetical protein